MSTLRAWTAILLPTLLVAEARALALLLEAGTPPKRRKKTRPSRAARERRITAKKQRVEKKRLRRDPEV